MPDVTSRGGVYRCYFRIDIGCVLRNYTPMPSPVPQALRRQPASPSFVARRLACIAWRGAPSPRLWLVETCRAELEWAVAEWRLLAGDPDHEGRSDGRGHGSHPSEEWRLP